MSSLLMLPRRRPRLPVEPVARPAALVETPAGFTVPGVAAVSTVPGRNRRTARALAARAAARPDTYVPLMLALGLPGIADLRGKAVA